MKNMGRLEEAIQDFIKAVEIDPKNSEIYANIGLLYRRLEKY